MLRSQDGFHLFLLRLLLDYRPSGGAECPGSQKFCQGAQEAPTLALCSHVISDAQVMECMDQMDAQKPGWGLTYFRYDWFSATSLAVARDVRYDTFITVYMSDCDYYPRVRQAGYETLDADSVCKARPSVHDMKGYMELPLDDYEATKEALASVLMLSLLYRLCKLMPEC